MFKFVKNSTLFVVGLGASLILGRWLKKREDEATATPVTKSSTATKPEQAADESAEVVEIPLPASAFENLEVAETAQPAVNGASKPKAKPKAEPKPAPEPTKAVEESATPDDLTQITGIGAKTAETLQAMGIATFADLAQADAEKIKEQVARVALDKIEGWIAEAKKRSMA